MFFGIATVVAVDVADAADADAAVDVDESVFLWPTNLGVPLKLPLGGSSNSCVLTPTGTIAVEEPAS